MQTKHSQTRLKPDTLPDKREERESNMESPKLVWQSPTLTRLSLSLDTAVYCRQWCRWGGANNHTLIFSIL